MDASELLQQAQRGSGGQSTADTGLLLGMSMWGLMASLLFSGAGFIYFKYGKSTGNMPAMVCGIILMVYPYFVTNTIAMVAAGAVLLLLPKLINR